MRLLLDQNISFRLAARLADPFGEVRQVRHLGLEDEDDRVIWQYARDHGLVIVTFDSDFYDFSVVWGAPPKIVWLRSSDQTSANVERMLLANEENIRAFVEKSDFACLELLGK
ncbi:MAG: DUF5615 family PIN-like protein [Flavobacteriales bacterium]|nr:DUF5615 family PIN-like protein [Flavobacteriales bacterium]